MADRTCIVVGCDRKWYSGEYCRVHHVPTRMCSIEGCDKKHKALGLCGMHYRRLIITGTTDLLYAPRERCLVEGCERKHRSNGYCHFHHTRWLRHGDPLMALKDMGQGDDIQYRAVHQRIRMQRGPATNYQCVDCGEQAAHWSYDHADPNERIDKNRCAYSIDVDRYQSRCIPCHRLFDA